MPLVAPLVIVGASAASVALSFFSKHALGQGLSQSLAKHPRSGAEGAELATGPARPSLCHLTRDT